MSLSKAWSYRQKQPTAYQLQHAIVGVCYILPGYHVLDRRRVSSVMHHPACPRGPVEAMPGHLRRQDDQQQSAEQAGGVAVVISWGHNPSRGSGSDLGILSIIDMLPLPQTMQHDVSMNTNSSTLFTATVHTTFQHYFHLNQHYTLLYLINTCSTALHLL